MAATHIAFELTSNQVRVAVATVTKGKSRLSDLFSLDVPPGEGGPDPAAAGATLAHELRARRLRPARVVAILPKAQVTTRRVNLPSTDPAEIERMARFEAERHIPFHPERHIVSHHTLSTEDLEGARVFLAAADEPIVQRVLDFAAAAGLSIDQITVSAVGSHCALLMSEGESAMEQTVALIDIGADSVDMSLISGGEVLFTRSVSGGTRTLLAPLSPEGAPLSRDLLTAMRVDSDYPDTGRAAVIAQFVDRLTGELRRMIDFSRREYSAPALDRAVVIGEGSAVAHMAEAVGERLGLPTTRVDLTRLAARCDKEHIGEHELATHFASLGGLLLPAPEGACSINLIPGTYRAKRQAQRMRQVILATGALALVTVSLTILYLNRALDTIEESIDRYRSSTSAIRPYLDEMEDKRTQIAIIQSYVDERNSALAILDFISGLEFMPPVDMAGDVPSVRISLTSFDYDREAGTLELRGLSRTFEDIGMFRTELMGTGFFSDVQIVRRDPRQLLQRQSARDTHEFVFRCQLDQGEQPEVADSSRQGTTRRRSTSPSSRQSFLGGR